MPRKKKSDLVEEKMDTISRNFYYYHYDIKYYDETNNTVYAYEEDKRKQVIEEAFKCLKALKYSNQFFAQGYLLFQNRYGNYIYLIIDGILDDIIKFRLMLCRDKLLPFIEENGKITPLSSILGKAQKVAEITHCVFFLNNNILAMEYNFAGSKARDLTEYLEDKLDSSLLTQIDIFNLVNIETLKKLHADREMSLFNIKVLSNSAVIEELIKEDDSFSALKCNKENIDYVELVWRRRISKEKRGFTISKLTPDFVAKIFKYHKTDFKRFKVKYGYGSEEIDLLSENYFCSQNFIPIQSTKTIDEEDAYRAMINYFRSSVEKYVKKD